MLHEYQESVTGERARGQVPMPSACAVCGQPYAACSGIKPGPLTFDYKAFKALVNPIESSIFSYGRIEDTFNADNNGLRLSDNGGRTWVPFSVRYGYRAEWRDDEQRRFYAGWDAHDEALHRCGVPAAIAEVYRAEVALLEEWLAL